MRAVTNPHTSIVIPSRNHASMLSRLIEGLVSTAESSQHSLELIIIDNQSDEADAVAYLDQLEQQPPAAFTAVKVLRYPKKFNYSAINNLAASNSAADYLCFLNNDVETINLKWHDALCQPMDSAKTGCVGAMLYYPDDTIQHAGVYLDEQNVAGHLYKNLARGEAGLNDFLLLEQNVSAVTAACLLVRRALFEELGGFNESLAIAFNDVDFCLRVQQAGYTNVWTPHAELYHHESKSRGLKHQRTWLQKRRHKKEVKLMKKLWLEQLGEDPHYAHVSQ